MRLSSYGIALLILFSISTSSNAQFFEDFETGSKGSYAGASVTLSTGNWFFDDALIGNLSNDKRNDDWSVRMDRRDGKTGNIYMQFDKANGADEISFYLANYGSTDGNTVQVQYSTNGGSSWVDLEDPIAATGSLVQHSLPVQVEGNIRFKFVQGGSERLNLDDVRITDYIEPTDTATIVVSVDDEIADSGAVINFGTVLVGSTSTKTLEIKNIGSTPLNITDLAATGLAFSRTTLTDSLLDLNETTEFTITFEPVASGPVSGTISIESDAENTPLFLLNLAGEGIEDGDIIPISDARELALGTRVTISGIVTVADEFRGPMYFQDATGGIAWYNEAMRGAGDAFELAVSRGDSIVISGELGEFSDLIQIVGDDVDYEFFAQPTTTVSPVPITVAQMNSGAFEGQLVSMDIEIDATALQGNTNYDISDGTGSGQMRISAFSDIVGSTAPEGETTVVGVVGIFSGTYQLLPRDLNDIDAEEIEVPGSDVPKDETFDIVTWNIEWFGAANGPDDDNLQLQNVKAVIDSIGADIYALQEISNPTMFEQLINELEDYGGFQAGFSQQQKTAYLFRRESVDSLDSGLISTGMTTEFWANGRFPLMFRFMASDPGCQVYCGSLIMSTYNIHAKATTNNPSSDYNQRINASTEVKAYLDTQRDQDAVILIGDYNDEIGTSVVSGNDSPYKNFVDDVEYTVVTKSLEDKGFGSHSGGAFFDHITFSSELSELYFEGTEQVTNTSFISSYLSTTSDHYPILVRFNLPQEGLSTEEPNSTPDRIILNQNYPNPFNPSTVISYQLAVNSDVLLKVYDMTGREVATLVNSRQNSGEHKVSFDASSLASGVYMYRLIAGGEVLTRKMLLIK